MTLTRQMHVKISLQFDIYPSCKAGKKSLGQGYTSLKALSLAKKYRKESILQHLGTKHGNLAETSDGIHAPRFYLVPTQNGSHL